MYSFCTAHVIYCCLQGLLKAEGKARFGDEFTMWQRQAEAFTIDAHAPVRELWYRASLAWQDILQETADNADERCALVVAHNAVNQALIGSALGLPPRYFRRLLQVCTSIAAVNSIA